MNNIINSTKEEFDSKPVYNKRYLKTKIKSSWNEATDFHHKTMPKADSNYTCLALILIDYVFKIMKTIMHMFSNKCINIE